jgi:hypothetical protein
MSRKNSCGQPKPDVRFGSNDSGTPKRVLVVRCDPATSPAYLKDAKTEYFYIRVSGTTSELPASKIHDYVKQRFRG